MKSEEWIALAERCEKAAGPRPDINADIGKAVWPSGNRIGFYTSSLDAITALIERELPGWRWTVTSDKRERDVAGAWVWVERRFLDDESKDIPLLLKQEAEAVTPALALCAAFCFAKAEEPK